MGIESIITVYPLASTFLISIIAMVAIITVSDKNNRNHTILASTLGIVISICVYGVALSSSHWFLLAMMIIAGWFAGVVIHTMLSKVVIIIGDKPYELFG